MKNVIFITIDAFCYKNLKLKVGNYEVTPFLNKLSEKSLHFNNMYSQAPYTEASLVNILGCERTLENGGYLFGNGNVEKTLFSYYKQYGYRTISVYSPYVYSKGYLREVDAFYFSRIYSIQPLFHYRFSWYRAKVNTRKLLEEEYKVCMILLEEAFETWQQQCEMILNGNKEVCLLLDTIASIEQIEKVKNILQKEIAIYRNNKKLYINNILKKWKEHILIETDRLYNRKKKLALKEILIKKYNPKLEIYQNKYSQILRKEKIDWAYITEMMLSNNFRDAINLLRHYYLYYKNNSLKNYFKDIDENSKTEVDMEKLFSSFFQDIVSMDMANKKYFTYIHVQDFHLPSVFHSVNSEDINMINSEMNVMFELLSSIDDSFKGNIIAALSARYCDLKIQNFFNLLKKNLKEDFIFVITADHGYPCYGNPPRPHIYNQTYTEAFHIPMIIYDESNEKEQSIDDIKTNIDGIKKLNNLADIYDEYIEYANDYVLIEHAGPGCPIITEKDIWYTLIDNKYRISVECMLKEEVCERNIVAVYDLVNDPSEKFNILKEFKTKSNLKKYLEIFQMRHACLQKKNKDFYKKMIDGLEENNNV